MLDTGVKIAPMKIRILATSLFRSAVSPCAQPKVLVTNRKRRALANNVRAKSRRYVGVLVAATWMISAAAAQQVYVSGLELPTKVITIPNGYLLVTEVGSKPNTGRATLVAPGGATRALVAGLPSGLSYPTTLDPDGPSGLYLSGRVLYIVNGEGDALRAGTQPGTVVPNPQGISSPILSSILKVTFDRDVDQYQAPFTLKPEDHFSLALGNIVTLDDGSGKSAVFEIVTNFPDTWPDAVSIYRNSHPFGVTMNSAAPNTLFTVDAGMNLIWQTNATTGRTKVLTRFANVPNVGIVGPPTKEAVPNSVKTCGDSLLVSLLSGGPFAPFNASVMLVNPVTGEAHTYISNLNAAIDVECAARPAPNDPSFLVLEYSVNQGATPLPPGRVMRYDSPSPTVWLDGLKTPTSLALDESTGTAYIVSRSDGKILTAKYR